MIGTGGASPFGDYCFNPQGIRIDQTRAATAAPSRSGTSASGRATTIPSRCEPGLPPKCRKSAESVRSRLYFSSPRIFPILAIALIIATATLLETPASPCI